jgi:putative copper resistance protein D
VPTAVALGTLAWSGHAAASEGMLAAPRLVLDILHLLAASIWLGALVLFLAMLGKASGTQVATGNALARFAGIGGVLVVTLALTGTANLWFLAPPRDWLALVQTGYGALLGIKLAVFSAMLGLAGLNRFALVPRLLVSGHEDQGSHAVRVLRMSIAVEFALAFVILLLVARLGMLDPGGA